MISTIRLAAASALKRLMAADDTPTNQAAPKDDDLTVRELEHFRHHYYIAAGERDTLLNERNDLMLRLQAATRPGGLVTPGASTAKPHAFPVAALPGARLPRIAIVDIGAQELTTEEHVYQRLIDLGVAHVVGFEPLEEAAAQRARRESGTVMLNYFVGDGGTRTFHINKFDATSSLYQTNFDLLDRFESLSAMCTTVRTMPVVTTRLDDVAEIADCDFLKIDVQGGELDVLKGAAAVLDKTVAIHCEVEFSHVYKEQPLFGEVDALLREAGFELIDIVSAGYATAKGLPRPMARSRLLWGEAIYFKTPKRLQAMGPEKTAKAAVIAHANYGMYDISAELLGLLPRGADADHTALYADAVTKPGVTSSHG
jgi:FkbM family methyltransferase